MHAGDKPYVVSPTGQVDLASRGLTLDAVDGIVKQLLSPESHGALDEFGAVQYELPPIAEFPGEHFTVVAARGGDDLWVEVRRHRVPDEDRIPDEFFSPQPMSAVANAPLAADHDDFVPDEFIAAAPRPGDSAEWDVVDLDTDAPEPVPVEETHADRGHPPPDEGRIAAEAAPRLDVPPSPPPPAEEAAPAPPTLVAAASKPVTAPPPPPAPVEAPPPITAVPLPVVAEPPVVAPPPIMAVPLPVVARPPIAAPPIVAVPLPAVTPPPAAVAAPPVAASAPPRTVAQPAPPVAEQLPVAAAPPPPSAAP